MILELFVRGRLDTMRARPEMYASNKESFGFQLLLLAEVALHNLAAIDGVAKTYELTRDIFGPGPVIRQEAFDQVWATAAVNSTKKFLEKHTGAVW